MSLSETKPDYERNLSLLSEEQRNRLPVSNGVSKRVLSYYGATLWDFTPYIHTRNTRASDKKIDFSTMRFTDSSCLTDLQHTGLLAGVKAFIYVRLAHNSPMSGKTLGASSIIALWRNLRPLLRWMMMNGIEYFSDLTSDACMAYANDCRNAVPRAHIPSGGRSGNLRDATLSSRFMVIEELWNFREHLGNTLSEHPWPGKSSCLLAGRKRCGRDRIAKTKQIPDRLMSKLVQGALRYINDGYGDQLLACRDARVEGKSIGYRLIQLGLANFVAVSKEITHLLTACYVVADGLSGMRDCEMTSLETGCYNEHEGWDGATYGWLKGITYKLEEDPKPAEWMVPPVVSKAIEMAERVTAPTRNILDKRICALELKLEKIPYLEPDLRYADEEALHKMKQHRRGLFLCTTDSTGEISTMSGAAINIRLKNLAKHLNLQVHESDLAQVRDKEDIKVGDVWPLAQHQFRRTFALYVARCILGDVRYLREHFKHWSLDMTLGYASGEDDRIDDTLYEEILEERQEQQGEIVYGWLDVKRNQHMAGAGGENIRGNRRQFVRVGTDLKAVARSLSKGYYLRGLGHSWCTEKECKGKGIYSVTDCKECENRVIDESHKTYWCGIRAQQIELLMVDDCGDPMWHQGVEALRYSEKILGDLGEVVEPYPIPPKPSERRNLSCLSRS
jgi:hypothetical protein